MVPVPPVATTTGDFAAWLSQAGGSLVVSTYHSNLLLTISAEGQHVTLRARSFEKPMGLAVQGRMLAVVTRDQLLVLSQSRSLAAAFAAQEPGSYDTLYLPRLAYFTGEMHIHDVGWGREGFWLVNTLFSCLATPSLEFSFVPRWQPRFITNLVPEDRCHLNGLAMADGQPRFVTALAATDTDKGWRPQRLAGGVVLDVPTGAVVMHGLCMPHSPRVHAGWLWLLSSGTGELLRIDPRTFQQEIVCAVPGYARGLCFVGPFAVIGLGIIRDRHISLGLPVQARHPRLHSGVAVVDLRTGALVGMLHFSQGCEELYDVQFLPGVVLPAILNPEHEAGRYALPGPNASFWLRPEPEPPP